MTVYDGVLEDDFLGPKLAEANAMASFAGIDDIEGRSNILDIDLDYFHTVEGTSPRGRQTILRLIRNCEATTIALEPDWAA